MSKTTTNNGQTISADDILSVVQEVVEEVHSGFSAVESISIDSTFDKDLGLDSLSRVQLISRVESRFKLALPERTFAEADTPRDLLRAVLGASQPAAIKTISEIKSLKLSEILGIPAEAETLVDVLRWHAEKHPDRLHIQMYEDDTDGEQLTYSQLYSSAQQIAAGLQSKGVQPADPVAIMLPSSPHYFHCFFGILMAGGIPVPIYPPARPSQLEDHLRRHSQILINCGTQFLITVPEATRVARLLKAQVPSLKEIIPVEELYQPASKFNAYTLKTEDTAFIQYTSGSTGQPKGVVLSHANLLANIRAMGQVVNANAQDVFVSWLPLYHDMGLIGAWLGSLYFAALFVVMPPLAFLARPERWLWAIHRYGGTLSASPNFGYEYCLRRIEDDSIKNLDLSTWRAAFNGAETVSPETIVSFCKRFAAYGFNQSAMMPVYGLAESSVGLAFPPIGRGAIIDHIDRTKFSGSGQAVAVSGDTVNVLKFPSNGFPLPAHQIRIADPAGHELPEHQEGRIQFQGPSSTSGYFHNPEKTRELFVDGWLDTGDLGYMVNGELYVSGRIKDIIIRAGRNIYPHELEEAVGNIEGIRTGRIAVFGSEDKETKTERLIVLAETRTTDKTARRVRWSRAGRWRDPNTPCQSCGKSRKRHLLLPHRSARSRRS